MKLKISKPPNNVIDQDSYDKLTFKEIVSSSSKVRELTQTEDDDYDENMSLDFTNDIFNSFYKMEPNVNESGPSTQRELIEEMMSLHEYKDLRSHTLVDTVSSAIATAEIGPQFLNELLRREKSEDGDNEDERSKNRQRFRIAARNKMKKAQEKAEEAQDALGIFAGASSGELERLPHEEKFKLAQTLLNNKIFKRIADLVGRFKNIVQTAVDQNPTHGYDEIVDITIGNDISRALPNELLKFKRQPLLFMKDMHENNLLNYNLKGEERAGHGPIICCVDVSGSMRYGGSPTNEEWSKSVVLALSILAEKQKRGFAVIYFDTQVKWKRAWTKDETMTIQDKMDMITFFSGGGTEYYEPLVDAFEIRKEQPTLKPADIVFITDGHCHLTDDQLQHLKNEKKETEVRLHLIEMIDETEPVNMEQLGQIADTSATINSNGEVNYVQDIIKANSSLHTK